MRIIQISAVLVGSPPTQTGRLFCLLEDGRVARYDVGTNVWDLLPMPTTFDVVGRYVQTVVDPRMPAGFELIHNVETEMWSWRKTGSSHVPPPAIPNEVGGIFETKDDAVSAAKQQFLAKGITQAVADYELERTRT